MAAAYADAFNSVTNDGWNLDTAKELIEYLFGHQSAIFLIATDGESLYGAVFGEIRPWSKGNSLRDIELFVCNQEHGKGVGRELLKRIVAEAIEKYSIKEINFLADGSRDFPFGWYKRIGMKDYPWVFMSGDPKDVLKGLSKK